MFKLTKKKLVAGVVAAGIIASTGVAYAYFTTDGSGTGSATAGHASTLTIHGTAEDSLYPGTSTTVDFTVDNPSPGHQQLGTIHLDSVTTDAAHSACVMTDFTMSDVVANQDFATGDNQDVTLTGTLNMANNGNQDHCKDAPLTLHLSA